MSIIFEPPPPVVPPESVRPYLEVLTTQPPEDWEANRTFKKEQELAKRKFHQEHPVGLRRHELPTCIEMPDNFFEVCAEKLVPLAKWLSQRYWGRKSMGVSEDGESCDLSVLARWLQEDGHDLELWQLAPFLTVPEMARLHHQQQFSGRLSTAVYEHPLLHYLAKLDNSAWHWYTPREEVGRKLPWKRVVAFHNVLMAFDFGLPQFDVTIDHAHSWMNRKGPPEYTPSTDPVTGEPKDMWLDGEFGLMVHHRGVHVLTIGLSTTYAGILLTQVQVRRDKGNRWLYKLPAPLLEHVVGRLYLACQAFGLPLYLGRAWSLHRAIKKVYPTDRKWNPKAGGRILRLYSQPLGRLKRSEKRLRVNGINFNEVVPQVATEETEVNHGV